MSTEVLPDLQEKLKLQPPYNVILFDDNDHTYDYVIEMLQKLFGHDLPTAFKMAQEVDGTGRVIVFTGPMEKAEFKKDQIHGYGADWRIERCTGSMSAMIEPCER